jgi:hypothetical protein
MPKDFAGVMHEWGQGALHSGSRTGRQVAHTRKGQKQALAIAFSEQRRLTGGRPPKTRKLADRVTALRGAGAFTR